MRLPSGSKVEAAIRCPASTVFPQVVEHHDAADAGTWRHAFIQKLNEGAEYEEALECVPPEFHDAVESVDFQRVIRHTQHLVSEASFAYDVVSGRGRSLGKNLGRNYPKTAETEIALTIDFAGRDDESVTVVDLKTGYSEVTPAAKNWQLRVAALAMADSKVFTANVALVHARPHQRAWWDVARLEAFDLMESAEHLKQLPERIETARKAVEAGQMPTLHVGVWCKRCPARASCPATTAMVRRMAGDPEGLAKSVKDLITPETMGQAWMRLKLAKDLLKQVEAQIHAFAATQPLQIGDGVVLGPVLVPRTELVGSVARDVLLEHWGPAVADAACEFETSKAGVERALKPVAKAKKAAGEKVTIKAEVEKALKLIEEAGGTRNADRVEVKEHKESADEALARIVETGGPL